MVELLMTLMLVYTITKALRRLITPLWALIECVAWVALGVILWYLRMLFGAEAVLTVLFAVLLIVVWSFMRHVRALREDVSRLNEAVARRERKRGKTGKK